MGGVGRTTVLVLVLASCAGITEGGAPDPEALVATDAGAPVPFGHGTEGHAGDAGHGAGEEAGHGHSGCSAAGIDGVAPACRLFADCAMGEVEVACDEATDTCTCLAPSGGGKVVAFDPAFCAVGDGFPAANLAAAARACGWSL